jgi:hypothetical protein
MKMKPLTAKVKLHAMVQAYLDTAIWSSLDDDDMPLDRKYSIKSFLKESHAKAERDCSKFLQIVDMDSLEYDLLQPFHHRGHSHTRGELYARLGHDFWLTRNRNGAGFWDGDWPEPFATDATEAAHGFGEVDIVTYRGRLQFTR